MAKGGEKRTTRIGNIPIPTDPEAEARAGGAQGYPEGYDIPSLRERRYLWTARLLAFISLLSMILNVTLGMALVSLTPLKEIRPFLVQLTETKDTVFGTIRPIGDDPSFPRSGLPFLTRQLVGEYVRYRHELVRSEEIMRTRWIKPGFVSMMSSNDEYSRFTQSVGEAYKQLRKADATIDVQINAINLVETQGAMPGVEAYQVEFETHTTSTQIKLDERATWIASIEVEYRSMKNVPANDVRFNPTGFTVRNYTYQQKQTDPSQEKR